MLQVIIIDNCQPLLLKVVLRQSPPEDDGEHERLPWVHALALRGQALFGFSLVLIQGTTVDPILWPK